MKRILSSLARFCSEHQLEKKCLVVSSYQVGHQVGEALAKEGGSWVNLHFRTLPALAQEIMGSELSRQGIKFIPQANSFFVVERVFRRLKEARKLKYFGEVEATTGIVRALGNSLVDLRMAGLKSSDLEPSMFMDERKGEEIIALLRAYEEELAKGKLVDLPGLYTLALKKLKEARPEYFLYLQDRPLEYLEREFLKKLAGERLILIPQEPIHGLTRPRRWPDLVSPPQSSPTSPASDVERLPWLFATKDAPPPFRDDTIDIFSAIGPTNEGREILRRIIAEKTALDEVEIVHPPNADYPSIMYALAAQSGIAMTFADGIPIAFTAPGKVLSGLVDWLEHGYLVSDLCDLIEAGAIKLPSGDGRAALSPLKASRYLKSAMIGWGRERYVARLETLVESIKRKAEAAELEGEKAEKAAEQIREVESLIAFAKDMLGLVPDIDDEGKLDFVALCRGVAAFIGQFSSIYGELDAEARGVLQSRLEEMAAFGTQALKRQTAFEWLESAASGLRVGASGARPGHLHLSSWRTGGYSGRPRTFVVGLDQSAFPGSGIQDPILLDEERERISARLRTSPDSLRESLWAMAEMLARLRGRVVLSYSSYDIIEERQSFPSSVILQAARLRAGDPSLDYTALARIIPAARGFVPEAEERILDEVDWWLGKLAPAGVLRDGMDSVKAIFQPLGRGIFAQEKREQAKVGEFEGKIKVDPKEFHPSYNPDIVASASRLELLAKCPFGYLLRYVLEVKPPEELELDQSRWLNPMERGSLLHDIFARFMRELRETRRKGEKPVVRAAKHGPMMKRIMEEAIEEYKEEIPPPSEAVFEQERREIEASVGVFLKAEEGRELAGEPLLFEFSFGTRGRASESDGETEERIEEPAILDLGKGQTIRVAGRIDRIDRLGGHHYRVIDYKTGGYSVFEEMEMFGKGRILQHALYAAAAEQILEKLRIDDAAEVVVSGYYFPTRRGEGKEIMVERFDRRKFSELVGEILNVLEKGHFVVNPTGPDADCEYCDYAPVCGGTGARARAKVKMEKNPDVFGLFERLKEYE